ncbi:BsuPI-related putative proteinase inhibitor [Halalkalibacter kiskunsagensis]|uniref:Intracellular proteinase inhibitor BsuPI domain-containing protein n=1 Tax=Halalkalibacter kiskunsagensis TaxID=1548599 RepID=A0ABV6K7R6_9BACI
MRKMIWLFSLLIVLSACGTGVNAPAPTNEGDEGMTTNKEWLFEVEAKQTDNELNVNLKVINNKDEDSSMDFSSGQMYELVLLNQDGNEVYRFSDGRMFTMALVHETFEPRESKKFSETISLDEIEAGKYTLIAQLVLAALDGKQWSEDGTFQQSLDVEIK